MKLVAMLIFWDEEPAQLEAWAGSVGRLADLIVAADGPFADFDHDAEQSPRRALNALQRGARSAGAEIDLIAGQVWGGQVEKRNAVLRRSLERGADWLMWSDADERVAVCDREAIRAELRGAELDVFWAARYTPPNPDARWQPDATSDERENGTISYPRIFRALEGMQIERVHWLYTGLREKRKIAFAIGEIPAQFQGHYDEPAQAGDLTAPLLFEHRQTWRSDEYRRRMLDYRAAVLQPQILAAEP